MPTISGDTIRLAPATPDHPELAAELMHDTNPYVFGYLHGHDMALVRSHMGFQWQQSRGLFSHSHCTVALHDDQLVGIALGFDHATAEAAIEPFVEQAAVHLTEAQFAHLASWFEVGRFTLPVVPDDAWYLQHLAAIPQVRGRGIGERLLRDTMDRARDEGFSSLHLDLYADNPALRLYQRAGLEIIVETRVPPLEDKGIPVHYRMACAL